MGVLFKCITGLLVLSVMGLFSPRISFCAGSDLFAKADKKPITRHAPKIMAEPEKEIPLAVAGPGETKKTPWMWIGLGAVAVIALAALAGGSSSSSSNNDPPDPGPDPSPDDGGTITVSW
jgi:hypothetical protein